MSVLRFGVYVDELDDVFREIEVRGDQFFQDFHLAIAQAYKISTKEQASFFVSNNRWQKINEITLGTGSVFEQAINGLETKIEAVLPAGATKLIYFNEDASDYTFLIQIEDLKDEADPKKKYPAVVRSKGTLSASGPLDGLFDEEMGYNEDDYSDFGMDDEGS